MRYRTENWTLFTVSLARFFMKKQPIGKTVNRFLTNQNACSISIVLQYLIKSDLPIDPQAKKVHIVVIGVGGHDRFQGQLEEIADPGNVHTVDNMDELTDIFDRILDESCSK